MGSHPCGRHRSQGDADEGRPGRAMSEQGDEDAVPEGTLGWRLNRALAHAGISAADMAADLGVSRATVSRWINDHGAPPRVGYVKLWALRCGVSLEWVLAWPAERGELIPIARQAVNITSLSPAPGCGVRMRAEGRLAA